jgi:GPI ethanolamine phosphate transferase 3 subunit O
MMPLRRLRYALRSRDIGIYDPTPGRNEMGLNYAKEQNWVWIVGFWVWVFCVHAVGILIFIRGFFLTRLVVDEKSSCTVPPIESILEWEGQGTVGGGCWHPKAFERAVVVVIDALRYDFIVPLEDESQVRRFHNAFPFMYETAIQSPTNAFLRPFIADAPTTTLVKMESLMTGTLPTVVDVGGNVAAKAIEEDNLLLQLRDVGKKIVHLGDNTWYTLFPGHFEGNISQAYDGFDFADLDTVDNGVIQHIIPLMEASGKREWDFLIGHLLGVDHAGHSHGPEGPAMATKLRQMDQFIRNLTAAVDDDTLLVVLGDHGMDGKGGHGGESDVEVGAALWMYSKRPFFGRTRPQYRVPPATTKMRPVRQTDLVPTLSLLLGNPIPYSSLGRPIEEAFVGVNGNDWENLAAASRLTAVGVERYYRSYLGASGIEQSSASVSLMDIWKPTEITAARTNSEIEAAEATYLALIKVQEELLGLCKEQWALSDIPNMAIGIAVILLSLVVLLLYISRNDTFVLDDKWLSLVEKPLNAINKKQTTLSYQTLHKRLVLTVVMGTGVGAVMGILLSNIMDPNDWHVIAAASATLVSIVAAMAALLSAGKTLSGFLPTTLWGWLSVILTVNKLVGFASTSYVIWEESIIFLFIATFSAVAAISAFCIPNFKDRTLVIYHSVVFALLALAASFSRVCREDQMPYCISNYSEGPSGSASWRFAIPFVVSLVLPSIIISYLEPPRSSGGLTPTWIVSIFRMELFVSAVSWLIDTVDDDEWITGLTGGELKTARIHVAQLALGLVFAGMAAFIWTPSSVPMAAPTAGNANGIRFLLLPVNILGACILMSKPMGAGTLALMMWQILSLLEILTISSLANETIGPVVLGLLGDFYFFKTGHQAVVPAIQWGSAFLLSSTVTYPWSPLALILNNFAGPILATSAIPLLILWKAGTKRKGVLEAVSRALSVFVIYFAVEALAAMGWAGLSRGQPTTHLVFRPRFIMGAAMLLLIDAVGIVVALLGTWVNAVATREVLI